MQMFRTIPWIIFLMLLTACPAIRETSTTGRTPAVRPTLYYSDYSYSNNVRTVELYREGLPESYPVLYLKRNQRLVLEFDELMPESQRESDLFVDIISCDASWQESGILPIEFYEGFLKQRITNFQRSQFTKIPYVHYEYSFPRENEFFKMSGNYLLKVYKDNDENKVLMTRRFVVAEQEIQLSLKYQLSGQMIRQQMESFSFEAQTGNIPVFNASNDLNVKVLQNFRWDNALEGLTPRFQNNNRFEYFIDILQSFKSGNEFRRHESESINLYGRNVQDIEERENVNDLYIFQDSKRIRNTFGPQRDRNGSFVVRVMEHRNDDLNADYLRNHFFIKSDSKLEGDVYVFGEFTDWNTLPQFRMDYNEQIRRYEGEFLLKQGIYDYQYVLLGDDDDTVNPIPFEGMHSRSENFYTILIYYRYPTDRNDRLLGFQPINYKE
ncbi:MAG: DUF5103 domain-containing protein [Bacteroidia bacterium]|nr:DUF5103 domain-containing protein [Bacteroidia bacterium]